MKELNSTDIVGTSGIRIWMTYPLMIRWKKIQRDELDIERKENIISGINSSIIVDCTCLLEGILDLLIREKIYFQEDGSYEERINDQLLDRLQNAQFNEYQSLFYLVYGKELSNITENQTWKCIKSLFSFRNLIVHGNGVLIDFYKKNNKLKIVGWGKYKTIIDYLIEEKLIPGYVDNYLEEIDIFSSEIADFYFSKTLRFAKDLTTIINENNLADVIDEIQDSLNDINELNN